MPIVSVRTWGRVQRPWGFEVRVDLTDDTGFIHNREMVFKSEPDDATLTARVALVQADVEASLLPPTAPEAQYRVICEDGTEVLL